MPNSDKIPPEALIPFGNVWKRWSVLLKNTKAFFASGGPPVGVGEEATALHVAWLADFGEELLLFVEFGGGRGGGGDGDDVWCRCWEGVGESGIGRGGSDG